MFAVRYDVLAALVADKAWCERLEKAKTTADVEHVVAEFGRAKGYLIVEVPA